jgi:hypothetical protein
MIDILINSDPAKIKAQVCNKQVVIIGTRRYQFYSFEDDIIIVPRSLRTLVEFAGISSLVRAVNYPICFKK